MTFLGIGVSQCGGWQSGSVIAGNIYETPMALALCLADLELLLVHLIDTKIIRIYLHLLKKDPYLQLQVSGKIQELEISRGN